VRLRIPPVEGPVTRRALLAGAGAVAAALWPRPSGALLGRPRFPDHPFGCGVASGDPDEDGMVLWTRLAPRPLELDGGMPRENVEVRWQLAEDEGLRRVVREGRVIARPEFGHSVHVELEGLQPGRWYWYRFTVGGEESPVGRTRTLPELTSLPRELRFAFASCQHFETGLYTAYEHMLAEAPDLVVHLGDYIYEGPGRAGQLRRHEGKELDSVEEYRRRYAQYRTDPALRAMHAAAPWVVTWDDHEFDNNYANAVSEERGVESGPFLQRRARAYQAYYEAMPLRRAATPRGPDLKLYRRLHWGRLAQFFVLDTRQYRTDQPCGDGNKPPCAEVMDPKGTLLGTAQREWLFKRLDRSAARWNILAQQVMLARVNRSPSETATYSMDQWPGYEFERRRLLRRLHESRVANPVVLTGDIHTNWANEVRLDPDDGRSPVVAAEFVGTSISSGGDGTAAPALLPLLYSRNPFVKFHSAERGYVSCRVTPAGWRTEYQCVPYVSRPGARRITRAAFELEPGSSTLLTG
jgi:alkaline phosphatase D